MMTIREALAEDVPTIIDLAVEMVLHSASPLRTVGSADIQHYRREDLQTLSDLVGKEHTGVFVAEQDGQVVGHIVVVAHQRDSSTGMPQAWIYDLSTRAGFWGRGIGQALMARAESFAQAQGMAAIGLGVTLANRRALDFYLQQGYQQERVQMLKNLPG